MKNEMQELYKQLAQKVLEHNKNMRGKKGAITICPAIKGNDYDKNAEVRLMFIGRAINGWCYLNENDNSNNVVDRLNNCENCGLGWVKNNWNWDKCGDCDIAKQKLENGIYNNRISSPFWNMVHYICKQHNITEDNWYNQIVWSNLYKASYADGGNPDGFYKEQIEQCNKILIEEITEFNPTHIYFITESAKNLNNNKPTWFCEEYKYDKELNFKKVYEFLFNEGNKHIEVNICARPEFHKLEEVLIKNMKELPRKKQV